MATLPPLLAGLPDMAMSDPSRPQGLSTQPSTQLDDPEMAELDQSLQVMSPTLDDSAIDSFLNDAEQQMNTGSLDIPQLADKAVGQSFSKGVQDLENLLGDYLQSDFAQQMQQSRSALQNFLKSPGDSPEILDSYRQTIQPLVRNIQRIRQIADRTEQGKFIKTMQASQDQVINQMISDVTGQDPNGAIHLEYLITGKTPRGVPLAMMQNQAEKLWQQLSMTVTNGLTNQVEALLQRDIKGTLHSQSLQNGVANANRTVMQTMQPMQQKIQQIQQVNAPVFNTSEQIKPIENKPIQRQAIQRFTGRY